MEKDFCDFDQQEILFEAYMKKIYDLKIIFELAKFSGFRLQTRWRFLKCGSKFWSTRRTRIGKSTTSFSCSRIGGLFFFFRKWKYGILRKLKMIYLKGNACFLISGRVEGRFFLENIKICYFLWNSTNLRWLAKNV